MLNAKALGELLTRNRDERLCRRWCLVTPNGTLLAYSQPTDIKDLRKQVATAVLTWQEYTAASSRVLHKPDVDQRHMHASHLQTLVIESEASNVLIRQLQPQLLLMLEGGVPPRKLTFEPQVTAEGPDGEAVQRESSADSGLDTNVPPQSEGSSAISRIPNSVLAVHRMKLDAMAAAINAEFEETGFKMPDETANRFF